MKSSALLRLALTTATLAGACKGEAPKPSPSPTPVAFELKTEDEKTVYAVGLVVGRNLGALNLSPTEMDIAKRGIADAATGQTPMVDLQTYGPKIEAFAQARAASAAQGQKEKAQAFADSAAQQTGAVKTASGLVYQTLAAGQGKSPAPKDVVRVHYRGTLTDGTEFDSSIKRGQPVEFPLNQVIPCWTEGVQRMKVGEKARLVCPSAIAYGDQGRPPAIPGGATLVFEVELLGIKGK
jgi:FKBP-type peptidyl-prolyl cis-trans isomerase FkpA